MNKPGLNTILMLALVLVLVLIGRKYFFRPNPSDTQAPAMQPPKIPQDSPDRARGLRSLSRRPFNLGPLKSSSPKESEKPGTKPRPKNPAEARWPKVELLGYFNHADTGMWYCQIGDTFGYIYPWTKELPSGLYLLEFSPDSLSFEYLNQTKNFYLP